MRKVLIIAACAAVSMVGTACAEGWVDPPRHRTRTAVAVPQPAADETEDADMAAAEASARTGSADGSDAARGEAAKAPAARP
jgi:hypothetical protein